MSDKPDYPKRKYRFGDSQWHVSLGYVLLGLLLLVIWQYSVSFFRDTTISYSQFKDALLQGRVKECKIKADEIEGLMRTGPISVPGTNSSLQTDSAIKRFRTLRIEDSKLIESLEKAKVDFAAERPNILSQFILSWVLPIGILILLWSMFLKRMGNTGHSVLGFGKSRAKLSVENKTGVAFQDVAGCDEAKYELQEVVDFLKNPERYKALGASIPKGILLVGPPGTGKTLLAKAVAGEAKAPFYSLSGSDFVEMFVGVGAARVRDLFQKAKEQAPCIIFIDELDAIGRHRGVHIGAVNDEREQTLNQLLVEMDGFEPNTGIILLSATNRPDVLDRALLRPGRFDRQVIVDAPDLDGRLAILHVHTRKKPLHKEVNLQRIAHATPGFSGADLANAMNEAALLAARRNQLEIHQSDLESAIEKVVAGPERKSRRLSEESKRRIAYHEVGHSLVSAFGPHADSVHKISIVPRGRAALGYTMQMPPDDQYIMTRSEIEGKIRGLLGGRAAEEEIFHEVTTGAQNDLERATILARQMVCVYGMSEMIGLAQCGQQINSMNMESMEGCFQRDCSEDTAKIIDAEVKKILDECYNEARSLLKTKHDLLNLVVDELLKHETLDGHAFYKLIGLPIPAIPSTSRH